MRECCLSATSSAASPIVVSSGSAVTSDSGHHQLADLVLGELEDVRDHLALVGADLGLVGRSGSLSISIASSSRVTNAFLLVGAGEPGQQRGEAADDEHHRPQQPAHRREQHREQRRPAGRRGPGTIALGTRWPSTRIGGTSEQRRPRQRRLAAVGELDRGRRPPRSGGARLAPTSVVASGDLLGTASRRSARPGAALPPAAARWRRRLRSHGRQRDLGADEERLGQHREGGDGDRSGSRSSVTTLGLGAADVARWPTARRDRRLGDLGRLVAASIRRRGRRRAAGGASASATSVDTSAASAMLPTVARTPLPRELARTPRHRRPPRRPRRPGWSRPRSAPDRSDTVGTEPGGGVRPPRPRHRRPAAPRARRGSRRRAARAGRPS